MLKSRLAVSLAISLAAFTAGCSSGSPSTGVAHVGKTTGPAKPGQSKGARDLLAFSECMRSHGLPKFPDPDASGRVRFEKGTGMDPNSSAFAAAQQACKTYLPSISPGEQSQTQAQLLKWAQCMRAHGISNFPDPTYDGGMVRIQPAPGVNLHSPQFKAAQQACQKLAPEGVGGKQ